jgi:hypothetical protein
MTVIDVDIHKVAVTAYAAGIDARVYGRPRTANPYPSTDHQHEFWIDGWTEYDFWNGGGAHEKSAELDKWVLREDNDGDRFSRFFTVPVVMQLGHAVFGEWKEFETGGEASLAGEIMAADHVGVAVLATDFVYEDDETNYTPIRIFGDVPAFLLGLLAGCTGDGRTPPR